MSLKSELARIENLLDTLDIDDPQVTSLELQADELAEAITQVEIAFAAVQAKKLEEQRLLRLKERIGEKFGDFNQWLEWAYSLYKIHDDFTVESFAREWNDTKSWICDSKIDALERIETLINHKQYDHFQRKAR